MSNTFEKMQAAGLVEAEETTNEEIQVEETISEPRNDSESHEDESASLVAGDDEIEGFELEDGVKELSAKDKKDYAWAQVKRERKAFKQDAKAQTARADKAENEVEQLREQINNLTKVALKKPNYADYDSDEEYEQAFLQYNSLVNSQKSVTPQAQPSSNQPSYREDPQVIDSLYNEAEALGLDADKFDSAATTVAERLGPIVTGQIVKALGQGASRTLWVLGNNSGTLTKLERLLAEDPTGMSGLTYLGEIKAKAKPKRKNMSSAPPPDKSPRGASYAESDIQRRFNKAEQKNDAAEMFKIRREARKAGVSLH